MPEFNPWMIGAGSNPYQQNTTTPTQPAQPSSPAQPEPAPISGVSGPGTQAYGGGQDSRGGAPPAAPALPASLPPQTIGLANSNPQAVGGQSWAAMRAADTARMNQMYAGNPVAPSQMMQTRPRPAPVPQPISGVSAPAPQVNQAGMATQGMANTPWNGQVMNTPEPLYGGQVMNTPEPLYGGQVMNTPEPLYGGQVMNTPEPFSPADVATQGMASTPGVSGIGPLLQLLMGGGGQAGGVLGLLQALAGAPPKNQVVNPNFVPGGYVPQPRFLPGAAPAGPGTFTGTPPGPNITPPGNGQPIPIPPIIPNQPGSAGPGYSGATNSMLQLLAPFILQQQLMGQKPNVPTNPASLSGVNG